MANGLFGLLGSRPGGTAPARPAPRASFPGRPAPRGPIGAPHRFAEGGPVEDPEDKEAEVEVTPELKLAAFELLECLDNHYGDNKGGRAEALAKHLLAFFHLAEESPHEEGPHTEEHAEPEDGGYDEE